MRPWKIAALGAGVAAAAAGGVWLAMASETGGVAILGDDAPALHEAFGTDQALPVRSAAFTVVSVSSWDRLDYISDMKALCGADCAGDTGLVRAVRLSPLGSRKIVFVNHAAWPGIAAAADEGDDAPARDFSCLARTLAAERAGL
ncbi:MAG: hypothetical protein GVY27_06790, partial [Deinococcus-Thermus bacterium]|nr:hypothetical protein [Deinococcota bacterium]